MQAERLQNFTDSINHFLDRVTEQVEDTIFCFEKKTRKLRKRLCWRRQKSTTRRKYRQAQLANIGSGVASTADVFYADILSNLERIAKPLRQHRQKRD